MKRALTALAVSVGLALPAAALATMAAGPASADTPECASSVTTHGGVTGNYCGSQGLAKFSLDLAAPNKVMAYAQLTYKAAGTTNPAEDFEFYHPAAASGNLKLIELAPRGNPSGWCAAVSNSGAKLVLKRCNANSAAQLFQATGPDPSGGYTWDAASSGKAITNPTGAAYARAVLAPDTDSPGQSLTFEQ